ncbi:TonB-dependent receptor domain-containing protein [Sphingomonas sp. EC-HK361]|uniref:TonB-dependent receptor domain-containing protein n=1 Tax=Sphingomonas sp. EC-HK361 TaxID=2038397 RepID=UPI002D767165|nr:TonB-dependent receptor [Sphingomonas sp. EC-HK361]
MSATALATSLLISTAAFAQTTPAQSDSTVSSPATSDADQRVDQSTTGDEIVITGSRIRTPNAESVSPVTSVTGAELTQTARISVGDALNDLPQLRTTLGSQNSITGSLGLRGITALDLRGLGTTRTLTLVNGRREVAADIINNRAIVDTSAFPSDLIERVDVLTGGASSVYGSDAVAGVVNFILKDNYDGLALHAQSGVTIPWGDAGTQLVSVVGGKNFDEGRGNIAINAEYAHQSRYYASGRPDYRSANGFVITGTDPAGSVNGSDGIPDRLYFRDIRSTTISLGGQLGFRYGNAAAPCGLDSNPNTAARSAFTCAFLFQPGGSLTSQTGQRVGVGPNGSFIGGNGYTGREGQLLTLSPDVQRYAVTALGHYDFSPAFTPFFEARYVKTKAFGSSSGPFFSQGQTLGDGVAITGFSDYSYSNTNQTGTNVNPVNREGIRLDNPYLSAAARGTITSQLTAAINSGVNPNTGTAYAATAAGTTARNAALAQVAAGTFRFSLRRNWLDLGIRDEFITRETFKLVGGIRGDFNDDWHYELSTNYGEHDETNEIRSNINRQRYLLAIDTTRNAAGQIVCRSQIDSRYAGVDRGGNPAQLAADIAACVPINPFGEGSVSDAARQYLTVNSLASGKATQFVANGFVSGDLSQLFDLPGGPIGFSLGGEYRRETLRYDLDKFTQSGYAFYNAIPSFRAPSFEVKEAFAEVNLPIVKDLPLLRELTLTGSGRVSDYKGSVGTVYTYQVGGRYKPINDLMFRGDYAKSVRSPYLGDLYATTSQNFATVTDPCSARNLANGTTYRVANCNAAGRPSTYDYVYSASLEIKSGGNPNLQAETSKSLTLGAVYSPSYIPGLVVSGDFYDITVDNVISAVSAQNILNLCYDSPTLNNPFCGLFQRAGSSGGPRGEEAFRVLEGSLLQSSANFAKLKARGVDVNVQYNHRFGFGTLALRGDYTHVIQRDNYTNPLDPKFKDVVTGELGDPQDLFNINADLKIDKVTFGYGFRWIGRQYLNTFEDYNSVNGLPPQNTDYAQIVQYPITTYSDVRVGYDLTDRFSLQLGVNNIGNTIPPFGLVGSGGGAIYDSRGRFGYISVRAKIF